MKNESSLNLAKALVSLFPGWTVRDPGEDCRWADLVREADGATVRIVVGGYKAEGRVTFRGVWPKFTDGTLYGELYSGGKAPAITCGVERAPEALAKEIQRRLMPEYDRVYAEALSYVTYHNKAATEAETVAAGLAALIDGEVGVNGARRGDGVAVRGEPSCVYRLAVKPAYGQDGEHARECRVDFEVHGLDPQVAAQVLQIIKEHEERAALQARIEVREPEVVEDEEPELVYEAKARRVG